MLKLDYSFLLFLNAKYNAKFRKSPLLCPELKCNLFVDILFRIGCITYPELICILTLVKAGLSIQIETLEKIYIRVHSHIVVHSLRVYPNQFCYYIVLGTYLRHLGE